MTPAAEPWYASGIRFECQRCGRCCRGEPGVVWVAPHEIDRMSRHLGISHQDFRTLYLRRLGFRVSLRERPDGDCILFNNGCSVYPVRPTQCSAFPFWKRALDSLETFRSVTRNCPGAGRGRVYSLAEICSASNGLTSAESSHDDV